MKKGRAGLIFSISVGLTAILAASVSTYAWFVAESQATVEAISDSAEITVAAPDPVNVSNPEVYMYRGDPAGKVVGTHYTQVSTVGLRTIDDFYPGEQITFAIKVTATSGSISSGSMDLTYRGYSLSNRKLQSPTTKVISILSAIKMSTGANSTGAYPSMTQKLTPIARGSELLLSNLTLDSGTKYYKQEKITNAINAASIGGTTAYFFFSIEFLNTTATFYKEVNSSGAEIYNTPDDSGTRYFTGDNNGSSSCYEGLNFDIKAAEITVA